ncbi:MAG: ATP synthase subunit I [Smithellaceae bacterium]|nr:ATP synthase subunit I [Smithellaceae bacterium]
MSSKFTLGIFCGGLICIINFHWLYRNLRNVFQKLANGSRASIMVRYYIRFALTAVVLYFLISRDIADVIGLLIGLSVVVINIVCTVILTLSKKNFAQEVR